MSLSCPTVGGRLLKHTHCLLTSLPLEWRDRLGRSHAWSAPELSASVLSLWRAPKGWSRWGLPPSAIVVAVEREGGHVKSKFSADQVMEMDIEVI